MLLSFWRSAHRLALFTLKHHVRESSWPLGGAIQDRQDHTDESVWGIKGNQWSDKFLKFLIFCWILHNMGAERLYIAFKHSPKLQTKKTPQKMRIKPPLIPLKSNKPLHPILIKKYWIKSPLLLRTPAPPQKNHKIRTQTLILQYKSI